MNLWQKIFIRLFCFPPPGRNISRKDNMAILRSDPLRLFKNYFGKYFLNSIENKVVIDIGCGEGYQVIGLILEGAKYAIGLEIRPIFLRGQNWGIELDILDKVKFTISPIRKLGESTIDVAISQNSFEHFLNPKQILDDIFYVLKENGKIFIIFGPPWLHPMGCHLDFMLKFPWMHILFPERTLMTVRRLYKNDNAIKFEDVEGGLNKMTIKNFKSLVKRSGFNIEKISGSSPN